MARESVVVAHALEPPPLPVRSVSQVGMPPAILSTCPFEPFKSAETTPALVCKIPVVVPTVSVPETLKLPAVVTVPAAEAKVKLVKLSAVPFMAMEAPLLSVVVPLGEKVLDAFTVKAPATPKLADGWAVGVAAIVNPVKLMVPGEVKIVKPTALIVIVPVGLKVEVEGTVNVLAMLKLPVGLNVVLAARVTL